MEPLRQVVSRIFKLRHNRAGGVAGVADEPDMDLSYTPAAV